MIMLICQIISIFRFSRKFRGQKRAPPRNLAHFIIKYMQNFAIWAEFYLKNILKQKAVQKVTFHFTKDYYEVFQKRFICGCGKSGENL